MSDGTIDFTNDAMLAPALVDAYAPLADRKPALQTAGFDIHALAEWLPRLGTVLWLYRDAKDPAFPRARLTSHGVLLFEHPALTALANCTAAHARSAVTPRGPREWIDFDANGATIARMYLLPDTDCLAWDGMLRDLGEPQSLQAPRARRALADTGAAASACARCVRATMGEDARTRIA